MKRLTIYLALSFLCLPILGWSQSEVPLALHGAIMNFETYLAQAETFKSHYHGTEDFSDVQYERVEYASLKQVIENTPGDHSSQYIKGLKIYYGLTEQNEIILYYVPVYANYASTSGEMSLFDVQIPEGGFNAIMDDSKYDIYYVYDGQLYDLRKDGIQFEEAYDNVSRYFFDVKTNPGYEMNKVLSVFFPTQEIERLYLDNVTSDYNTGNIFFTSAAEFVEGGYIHHLIMTTIRDYDPPYQNNNNFLGMAADMDCRCPFSCQNVAYPALTQ